MSWIVSKWRSRLHNDYAGEEDPDHRLRFEAVESKRSETFASEIRQIEFDFLQAEAVRRVPEQQRGEIFKDAQIGRCGAFVTQEKNRLDLFEQAEKGRQDTFRLHDDQRHTIFEASSTAREEVFLNSLEEYSEQYRWYTHTVETLFSTNRQHRQSMYERTIKAISTEFAAFLQIEEDTFSTVHTRRVSLLSRISDAGSILEGMGNNADPLKKSQAAPTLGNLGDIEPGRYINNSVPRYFSGLEAPVTQLGEGVNFRHPGVNDTWGLSSWGQPDPPFNENEGDKIIHPSLSREINTRLPSSSSTLPVDTNTSSQPVVELNPDYTPLPHHPVGDRKPSISARFIENEDRRDDTFRCTMRSHNSTFQAAESDRSCLANSREEEFRRTLDVFDSQFVSNMEVFSDRFKEREFSRDEAENHRMQMFDSVQTMHDTQLDQRLSRYTRQLKAIIDAEVDAATSLERTAAHLLSTMDEKVQKVRRRHMLAFYKLVSPAYRDVIVAEPEDGPPTTPSGSALVGSSPNSNRDDRYREYPVDWHDTERCRPAWRTVTRRKRRHKSPSRRTDLEPESSFIPGTLMQLNSIGNTLHIPATNELEERVSPRHESYSRDDQIHRSSTTQDFLNSELNQQQKIFLSGTRRRGVEVEQAMQKWQQVYAVNELKRQERFRAQEYSNSEAFMSMEQKHAVEFDKAQRERARKFGANEALRETLFIQEEKRRSTLFKEKQERRESRFSLLLGELLATARKHELEREEDSSGWELSIQTKFEDKIDQWKQQFISDEVKRKEQALSLEGEGSLISKLTSYLLTTNLGFVVISVLVESIIYLTKQYK